MNFITKLKNKKQLSIINESNENIEEKDLFEIIEYNSDIIRKLRIKKTDTIAIILENGPAFITVSVCVHSITVSMLLVYFLQ